MTLWFLTSLYGNSEMSSHLWNHLIWERGPNKDPEIQHSQRKGWSSSSEYLPAMRVHDLEGGMGGGVSEETVSKRTEKNTLGSWRQNLACSWLARSQNSPISKGVQRGSHCPVTSAARPTEALLPHLLSFCFSAKSYPLSFKDSHSTRSLQSWCQRKGPAYLLWNNTALVGSRWVSGLERWREAESEISGSTHRWVSGAAQFHWNSGPISQACAMYIFVEGGILCLLSNLPGNQW